MKAHEIEVTTKDGKELTVSIDNYMANKGKLKTVMPAKEAKEHCDAYFAGKEKMKAKMEAETLKNKSA